MTDKKYIYEGVEYESFEEAEEAKCVARIIRGGAEVCYCRYCGKPNPVGYYKCEWCLQ